MQATFFEFTNNKTDFGWVLFHHLPFSFRLAAALSTRLGYGRPALEAIFLASAIPSAPSLLDDLFGFLVSQNGFFISYPLSVWRTAQAVVDP